MCVSVYIFFQGHWKVVLQTEICSWRWEHWHFSRTDTLPTTHDSKVVTVIYSEPAVATQPASLMWATGTLKDMDTHTKDTYSTPKTGRNSDTKVCLHIRESYLVTCQWTHHHTETHNKNVDANIHTCKSTHYKIFFSSVCVAQGHIWIVQTL